MLFCTSFSLVAVLQLSSLVSANPARAPSTYNTDYLGPNLELNGSWPNALLSGKPTERPEFYNVPHALYPTSLQIAWEYKELPRDEFHILILRALNTLVNLASKNPIGDKPIEGATVNFRSPSVHIQVTKEDRRDARVTIGVIAIAIRGIGEVMSIWNPTTAEIRLVVGGERIARVYIEVPRDTLLDKTGKL